MSKGTYITGSRSLILILACLLLQGCAHRNPGDIALRQQMIGTWSRADSTELTLAKDKRYLLSFKTHEMEAEDKGTWDIRDGDLVIKPVHTHVRYLPGATNMYTSAGNYPDHFKVVPEDWAHFRLAVDARYDDPRYVRMNTNIWERRRWCPSTNGLIWTY